MPTQRKIAEVAALEDRLTRAVITIGLNHRGLTVGDLQAFRRTLREQDPGIELRVVKNNLVKIAAERAGKAEVATLLNETTALIFGYTDVVAPPKALRKYLRERNKTIDIFGAYLDGEIVPGETVRELADIPSKPELMARLAGGINNPIRGIAATLHNVIREIAAVIDARAAQLEEQQGAPPLDTPAAPAADTPAADAPAADEPTADA